MEGDSTPISVSGLICDEVEGCVTDRLTGVDERLNLGDEIDEECVEMLIGREVGDDVGFKGYDPFDLCLEKSSNWDAAARLDAVNWMLNVRTVFEFQFSTVYLAMTYFDQFVSRQSVDSGMRWVIRLLSVVCLSVAVKMEELKVPVLSDYPLGDYAFEKSVIQRMELLVLSTLEWKMASVTPFAYFSYFIDKFRRDSEFKSNDQLTVKVKATQLAMDIVQVVNLMSCRPSSLAAAVIIAALDIQLNEKDLGVKLGLIQPSSSLKYEEIVALYCLLRETERKKCKTPELDIVPNWSHRCSPVVDEKSTSTTSITETKRLLSYDDNDKDHQSSSKKMCQ